MATRPVTFERERGVYDVRVTRGLAYAVISVGAGADRSARIQHVFRRMSDENIPIFLIKLHRGAVTFALGAGHLARVQERLSDVAQGIRSREDLALLTVVASSMRDLTGVMINIADSVQRAGARIYGVGDSHNSVQCLIDGAHVTQAVAELCATFGLEAARE